MSDREDPSWRRLPAKHTLAPQIYMEAPICLIETSPEGALAVRPEALRVLEGVTQPVVVVAIAGKYRTGKSYLMNRLAGKNKGFTLGCTIQAHTKGIWMWCLPHPRRADRTLVLLDTEGLGDAQKGNGKKDTWIFALAVLLSSTLVYNSLGTIDGHALEKLHYVTELTKHIKVKAAEAGGSSVEGEDAAEFVQFFPDFVWAVRDFTLQLEMDGHPVTEDEYLDWALRPESDSNEKTTEAKKCIRNFFPSRKCFTFDCPASRRNLLRLEELQEDQLDPEFQATARRFCDHVWDKARPMMTLGGHQVTGTALGNLAQSYVASINSGAVPCIENAVQALAQIENAAAVKEALARYMELMGQRAKLPTETLQEMLDLHAQCEGEALAVFTERAFRDDEDTFQNQLMGHLAARREEFCRQNEEASVARCQALLAEAWRELDGKISDGSYLVPGGHQRFLADRKEMEEKYQQEPGKGIKADEVLGEFLTSKEAMVGLILQTDKALTEKEQEMAEQAQALAAEMQQKLETEKQSTEERLEELKALMEKQQREINEKLKDALRREEWKKFFNQEMQDLKAHKETNKQGWLEKVIEVSRVTRNISSIVGRVAELWKLWSTNKYLPLSLQGAVGAESLETVLRVSTLTSNIASVSETEALLWKQQSSKEVSLWSSLGAGFSSYQTGGKTPVRPRPEAGDPAGQSVGKCFSSVTELAQWKPSSDSGGAVLREFAGLGFLEGLSGAVTPAGVTPPAASAAVAGV